MLVSLSDEEIEAGIPLGALWALCGALLYALYLVLLRRRVDNEDKLNIPMFFGELCVPNPADLTLVALYRVTRLRVLPRIDDT